MFKKVLNRKLFLSGILFPPEVKRTKWQNVKIILCIWGFILIGAFMGFNGGYQYGTGLPLFIQGSSKSILPPTLQSSVTTTQVVSFVKADTTKLNKYDVGFNCVEYALLLSRNADWAGLPAAIIRLDLEDGTQHMILAFATIDSGWLFVEPSLGVIITPMVGGRLGDKKITAMWYLDSTWKPF